VAASGACPTIRTSTFGSFGPYTLPFSATPGSDPRASTWGAQSQIFRELQNASAALRPCPGEGEALLSAESPAPVSAPSIFSNTALVFSVFRGRTSIAASACNASLSFS